MVRDDELKIPPPPPDLCTLDPFHLQSTVHPGHDKEVAQARLDRTRSGEEQIGQGITDRSQAEFVARFPLAEQGENFLDPAAGLLVVINPTQGEGHWGPIEDKM